MVARVPVWTAGRLIAALLGGFSVLALTLSVIGVSSVVSYPVAQRRPESRILMASMVPPVRFPCPIGHAAAR
jgi:hypothetical protein